MSDAPNALSSPTIRLAARTDFERLAALQLASWRDAYFEALPASYLEQQAPHDISEHWRQIDLEKTQVLMAEQGADAAGFIVFDCQEPAFIDNLHVAPGNRGGGIGRRLMAAAAARMQDAGVRQAFLWAFANNHDSLQFYERLGAELETVEDYPVFSVLVPSAKMVWSDVAMLAGERVPL
ncbi:MAG: GNAT family N-acetyltransferase [Rhodobacteraceae bacterium]|nr:GNAT family N-acetyltransferase [Paracoccaceae bacterium]